MKQIVDFLKKLLVEAGKIMLEAHNDAANSVKIKPGTVNFVTAYDVVVQEFLMKEIRARIPEAVFIAEEKENDSSALLGDCCFIIDPIDGTTNFIHDYRHSCISLAMLQGGNTVFGAVYHPYGGEMFCAVAGQGATLNDKPVHVSNCALEVGLVTFGTSPYYKDELADKSFSLARDLFLGMADVRRTGSAALDLAYLAAGRADAFFEWRLSPWDYAAGALLVKEAGGLITDEKGNEVTLSAACPVFAGTPKTHSVLLEMAEKYL